MELPLAETGKIAKKHLNLKGKADLRLGHTKCDIPIITLEKMSGKKSGMKI